MKTTIKLLATLALLLSFFPANAEPVMVTTDWLAKNWIENRNSNIVLVDTSDSTQHSRFHIPGAIHIDYSDITYRRKKDRVSFQVPNNYFRKLLGQKGISNDNYIVIYDDIGGLNAGRLFWQLEQIGHKNISVVDGGLVKWILEHRRVTNKMASLKATSYHENKKVKHNLATLDDVRNLKKTELLIDARSKDEYVGYPRYPKTGHIPGAQLWTWEDNVDFEKQFVLKSQQQILKQQKHIPLIDKNQEIVTYCRSGHRAAQTYLTLRSMGFNNIRLYDGSMAEYSGIKTNKLEQGCTKC